MTFTKSFAKSFLTHFIFSFSIGSVAVYSINLFLPFVAYSSSPLQWRLFGSYL